jgi:hypothetical protein
MKFSDRGIIENQYHNEAFGSWYILLKDRVLYDGRDFVFCQQVYVVNDWVDKQRINVNELTYDKFIKVISATR